MIFAATDTSGAGSLTQPAFLLNLGAVGFFLFMFLTDRVFSKGAVDRLEKYNERLITERDRALAERDEMIEVMKDFTHTAGAILQVEQPRRRPAARRTE